jgi:Bacterial SH3 domain
MNTRTHVWYRRAATCFLLATVAYLFVPSTAAGQSVGDKVRVPTSYANVHMGPSSGQQVLVLVPKDTVLTVTARRGEWIEVELDPILMKLGMKMRWYENEERGWMHDSTVEVVED